MSVPMDHLPDVPDLMDHRPDPDRQVGYPPHPDKGYDVSGKIMLSAIVILFFVVILMVCLHLYARWYLHRSRRHRPLRRNRRNRRTHIMFHEDPYAATLSTPTQGLDASILNSLPVFVYCSKSTEMTQFREQPILECAVCLSEFEDGEKGRLLPKCKHSFHIECIDMWFHSHSTCPLCRAPVEPGPESETVADVVLKVCELEGGELGPSSELCSECCSSETTSSGSQRKPLDIVVPRRNESFGRGEDSGRGDSPASQAFRSPMSRMLSFTRMLSRDRRNGGVSPSGGNAGDCSSVAESEDIEVGGRRDTRRE